MIRVHITFDPLEGVAAGASGEGGARGGHGGDAHGMIAGISDAERVDLLVSRVCDGEATAADWDLFHGLAQRVPSAWRTLAEAQRQHQALSLSVGVALHAADRVKLPIGAVAGRDDGWAGAGPFALHEARERDHAHDHHHRSADAWARVRSWGGWAAAAVVGAAWISGQQLGLSTTLRSPGDGGRVISGAATSAQGRGDSMAVAGLGASGGEIPGNWTSESAADAYLKLGQREGRVMGEVPQRLLVESRPLGRGQGYEVVYVRQFIEKARVPDLMRVGFDEQGQAVPIRINKPADLGAPQ